MGKWGINLAVNLLTPPLSPKPSINVQLVEEQLGRLVGKELEAALGVADAAHAQHGDGKVEAVHENGAEDGALGHRVLLQVRSRPAHHAKLVGVGLLGVGRRINNSAK